MKPEYGSPRLASLDVVRAATNDNRRRFSSAEVALVEDLFPEHAEFERLLESDRKRFLDAMTHSGIPQKGSIEPARAIFDYFARDLSVQTLAAELGLTQADLRNRMTRESETRQILKNAEAGTLKRQEWMELFGLATRLTGLGDTRTNPPLPYPYFGDKVGELVTNSAVDATSTPNVGSTGIDLVDAQNRDSGLRVDVWTQGERRSYREGELLKLRVRASQDSFLTLLSVDAEGNVVQLVPNRYELSLIHI